MSGASNRWLLLLLLALLDCERPGIARTPGSTKPSPSAVAPRQAASAGPPAAGSVTTTSPPPPLPALDVAVSADASPHAKQWRRLLDHAMGAEVERAWVAPEGLLLLTRTGGRAIDYRDVVPIAPAAREAAVAGRVVSVAEVWRIDAGRLERVWRKPIGLRPMVCEVDDCDIVALELRATEDAIVEIGGGGCEQAAARLAARPGPATTFDAFDRAALAAVCGGRGRFRWNGRAFSSVIAPADGRPAHLSFDGDLGSGPPAAAAPQPTGTPTSQPLLISQQDAAAMALDRFFEGSILSEVNAIWSASDSEVVFGLFVHRYPAAHSAYAPHTKEAALWASARSIVVAEVWAASPGKLRNVLRMPVGFCGLGEPLPVLTIDVEAVGGEVQVGDPSAPCAPDPNLAPPDAHGRALDAELGRRLCAARGRYRHEGRAFVRAAP